MDPTPPDPNAMEIMPSDCTATSNSYSSRLNDGLKIPLQESLDQGVSSSPPYSSSTDKREDSPLSPLS